MFVRHFVLISCPILSLENLEIRPGAGAHFFYNKINFCGFDVKFNFKMFVFSVPRSIKIKTDFDFGSRLGLKQEFLRSFFQDVSPYTGSAQE